MALEIYFNGRLLTQAHLNLLPDLLNKQLSDKALKKEMKAAFDAAGIPVPDLKVGDVVSWPINGSEVYDKGRILGIDERSGKLRVESKQRKRAVTVRERDVRVI